ncbi:hypothetical protein HNR19_000292 [Nocardioides thalensis]|uniref:Uncharacterized protein n=1 Tax=Nocardioides thalensis TaxID=1914755 RepID=A0A853BWZ5_9ACTN|nr:hypothetical protein [Nocardioides thalensis]NYI99593.1 hypothetical protein [Nocardioides thalensis]
MRLPDDDEVYEVDQTYLGPPGRYIAAMRHKAIFAWLVIAPLVLVLLQRLAIPMTLLTGGLAFIFTLWAAMKVADHTNEEVPVAAAARSLWNELTARRPPRNLHSATGVRLGRAIRPRGGWKRYLRRAHQQKEAARVG